MREAPSTTFWRLSRSVSASGPARLAILAAAAALLGGCASRGPSTVETGPDSPRSPDQPAPALAVDWSRIGTSVEGRRIDAATMGDGPQRVLLIAGIHGNEQEGLRVLDEVLARVAPDLAGSTTLRIVRDMNPDGTTRSDRYNRRGVDLNRNWPASNFKASPRHGPSALSEPETLAVYDEINAFDPDLVIVFHSTAEGPFVNYDGPAEAHAEAFSGAAKRFDGRWRVVPSMGYPTPGSLGTHVGVDAQVPILTIEFKRGQPSESVLPASVAGMRAAIRVGG